MFWLAGALRSDRIVEFTAVIELYAGAK